MKDLLKENYRLVEKKYRHFKLYQRLRKINILCFRKFLEFSPQDIDFIFGVV